MDSLPTKTPTSKIEPHNNMEATPTIDPELERGYNIRLLHDNFDGLISSWEARSKSFRESVDCSLDLSYGDGEKDKLDIFRCGRLNAPLFVFVHGGYWQRGDKSIYSYIAEPFIKAGIDVALIGYQLCPNASMTNIVDKIRQALIWLWKNAKDQSISQDRINFSGHSAGGHITAMLLTTNWSEIDQSLPIDIIKTAIPLSGLYQLDPIRKTTIGEALQLDDKESQTLSPQFLRPNTNTPILAALGGGETDAFHWQTNEFIKEWQRYQPQIEYFAEPDVGHMGLVERLATSDSEIFKKIHSFLR